VVTGLYPFPPEYRPQSIRKVHLTEEREWVLYSYKLPFEAVSDVKSSEAFEGVVGIVRDEEVEGISDDFA
jgi:hypothetical protein